jgi:hypothetical protein
MWKDRLKEVIYILENSNINEIEVRFWFRKIKVTKNDLIVLLEKINGMNMINIE